MLIVYFILFILYLWCSISVLANKPFSYDFLIIQITGFIVVTRLLFQEVSKKNLKIYLFLERIKLFFYKDTTSKWWFHARFDNVHLENVLQTIQEALKGGRFNSKCLSATDREIELEINELSRVSISLSQHNENCVDVVSRKIEVPYGRTKDKLTSEIEPFLQLIDQTLKPETHSFIFNVEFSGNNPYFNVYIAHLPPSQVEDFRVILHVNGNSPNNERDKVEISKSKVRITADSTSSFKELAESFILLTPDTKLLLGGKDA